MTNTELFLNKYHYQIQHVILFLGTDFTADKLWKFLEHTNISHLTVTGFADSEKAAQEIAKLTPLAKAAQKKLSTQVEWADPEKLTRPEGSLALVFDRLRSNTELLPFAQLKPDYLVGDIDEAAFSAFGIWEAFRSCCRHIQITTRRWKKCPQVLDWEKDDTCDTELSVIFPMYNVAQYLPQCIESVTAWKAPYVEFLFVNDGSPDNSRDVVLEYAARDPRIKLLDKQNGGCASARQYGLEKAQGRYIGFIDPDDFIEESMFRKLLRAAMVGSYDISYCGYNEYYESTGKSAQAVDVLGFPYSDGTDDPARILELLYWQRVAIWRAIFSADMLKKHNIHFYTDLRRFDDLPFFVETTLAAKSVICVNEHLYYYRLQRPGQDVAADDERLYVHFDISRHLQEHISKMKNQQYNDALLARMVATHHFGLQKIKPELKMEYARKAKADLKQLGGSFFRSWLLLRRRLGKEHTKFYTAVMTQNRFRLGRYKG